MTNLDSTLTSSDSLLTGQCYTLKRDHSSSIGPYRHLTLHGRSMYVGDGRELLCHYRDQQWRFNQREHYLSIVFDHCVHFEFQGSEELQLEILHSAAGRPRIIDGTIYLAATADSLIARFIESSGLWYYYATGELYSTVRLLPGNP